MTVLPVAVLVFIAFGFARQGLKARRRAAARLVKQQPRAPRALRAPSWFRSAAERADLQLDSDQLWTTAVAGALGAAVGGAVLLGFIGGLVVAGALVGGIAVALHAARDRRDRSYTNLLPEALELVARSLRAGASLHAAIAEVARTGPGPVASDFARIRLRTQHGEALTSAIGRWVDERPSPSARLAASALAIAADTGGASARGVDAVAASLRDHARLDLEVRALSSQARLSALVMGVAPVGFAAIAAATDTRLAHALFRTRLGLVLLAVGLALQLAGAAWMALVIRSVDR